MLPEDPWLLFRLRGRDQQGLLRSLRTQRNRAENTNTSSPTAKSETRRNGDTGFYRATAAVEEEIDRHYTRQLDELEGSGSDPELAALIEEFREDERAHRDAALAAGAQRAPAYPLLSGLIRLGCRAAIRISERV